MYWRRVCAHSLARWLAGWRVVTARSHCQTVKCNYCFYFSILLYVRCATRTHPIRSTIKRARIAVLLLTKKQKFHLSAVAGFSLIRSRSRSLVCLHTSVHLLFRRRGRPRKRSPDKPFIIFNVGSQAAMDRRHTPFAGDQTAEQSTFIHISPLRHFWSARVGTRILQTTSERANADEPWLLTFCQQKCK